MLVKSALILETSSEVCGPHRSQKYWRSLRYFVSESWRLMGSDLRKWCMSRLMRASTCLSTRTVARLNLDASFLIPSRWCDSLPAYDLSSIAWRLNRARFASSASMSPGFAGSNSRSGGIVGAVLILVISSSSSISARSSSASLLSKKLQKEFQMLL